MMTTSTKLALRCVCLTAGLGSFQALASDSVLPTVYEQDRFFVVPVVTDGGAMRLLTDTGGGVLLFDDAALRLKLSVSGVELTGYKGMAAKFPTFVAGKEIPAPKTEGDVIPIAPGPVRSRLSWLSRDIDGVMGQGWFADRVWTLDYPAQKLIFHPDGKPKKSDAAHRLDLHFRTNEKGERATNYPRIEVSVAGQDLSVLLATGSTVAVTADALKELGDGGSGVRATSLISASIFFQWRNDHPDWRFVPNAEEAAGEPMIEVPELTIAGYKVQKVWFTQRPDNNFRDHFSNWTDKPVEGAIGGNVLKGFRVILDYPGSTAWFEMP